MAKPRNARTGFSAINPSTRTGGSAQLLTVNEVKTLEDGRVALIGVDENGEDLKVVNPVGTASDKDFDPDMTAGTQLYVRSKSKEGEFAVADYTRTLNATPAVTMVVKAKVGLKMSKKEGAGPRIVVYGAEQAVKIEKADDITEDLVRGLIDARLLPVDDINNRKILIQSLGEFYAKDDSIYTKQQATEVSVAQKQGDGTYGVADLDARIAELTETLKAAVQEEIEVNGTKDIVMMPMTSIWGSKFMAVIPPSMEGKKPRKFSAADDFVTSVYDRDAKKRILRDDWKKMVEEGKVPANLIKSYGVLEVYSVVKATYDQDALKKAAQEAGLKLQYFKLQTDPKKINTSKLAQALVDAGVDVRPFITGYMIDTMESVKFPNPIGRAYLETAVHKPDLPKFDSKSSDHEEHEDHAADASDAAEEEDVPVEEFPDEIDDLDDVLNEGGPAPK